MGHIRAFFLRLWTPSGESYPPPAPSEREAEAKREYELQMARLKTALESRKRIQSSADRISREFKKA